MNVSGDWNRRNRILHRQTSLPLQNDRFRVGRRLAAGMTNRHHRLSAMPRHVMAARALGFSLRETGQETRHRRRRCPQQDSAQHGGGSYAIHFHESIS